MWRRADRSEYLELDLRSHRLLAEVPLHDVWRVDLPGGGPDRTIADVRSLLGVERFESVHPLVRALFRLRSFAGRIFGWDRPDAATRSSSFLGRLERTDRDRSLVPPGSPDGPFRVLYVHPREAVSEARNATVHAFLTFALLPAPDGYRLFWAIHVLPVGRITGLYMALIDPFRRWIVYPAILRHLHRSWATKYGGDGAGA